MALKPHSRMIRLIVILFLLIPLHRNYLHAKIIRSSAHASYQAALDNCVAGDVLILDKSGGGTMTNPPSGIQIVGGSASWILTRDVSDIVLVNHRPVIKQTGGKLRRVVSNGSLGRGSVLTHVNSCFFIMGSMSIGGVSYEIDGFLRHSTFAFDGSFMGTSGIGLMSRCVAPGQCGKSWNTHSSNFLVNATDPIGDGSGTLICNIVSHGQIDWTPVHVINGRGITVAHINSEYCEFSDPFVSIENGVECASVHHNPGGNVAPIEWDTYLDLDDGTRAYRWMGARWGASRIGGMNNSAIGGINYTPFRASLTGAAWSSMVSRDPYMHKWNANHGGGVNFAKALRCMSFGGGDKTMLNVSDIADASAYVTSSAAACTTAFINSQGAIIPGRLSGKPLSPGPSLFRPYVPEMPRLKLDNDGPGTNMSAKSGAEIVSAVNAAQTVYLGKGTFEIPATLSGGGTIYGAGKDETILKFPSGLVCTRDRINLYNLTVEGGTHGYIQDKPSCHDLRAAAMRFKGQSVFGIQLSCVQNCAGLYFIEFDGCTEGINTIGTCKSLGMNDNKAIDKFNIYGCTFKNLNRGLRLVGGTDGFISLLGCRFENISGTGADLQTKGNYVAGCDFLNCGVAIDAKYTSTIHNCNIQGAASSTGITGQFKEIVSCAITGCATAINVTMDEVIVSDCESDGEIKNRSTTWIGLSRFKNAECLDGARYGSTDLSEWVDVRGIPIDQTAPSVPENLQVKTSGAHNILTWNLSSDPESGIMQYIIERQGKEIGRTNFNYSANYHVVDMDGMWGNEGWPGAGVYKEPRPVYVDSGSATSFAQADYAVHAVNFAQVRSDNTMAQIRLWTHKAGPSRLTGSENGKYVRLSDSVYVGLGAMALSASDGEKTFTAVRYRTKSASGVKRGITELDVAVRQPGRARAPLAGLQRSNRIEIFTLSGARISAFDVLDGIATDDAVIRALSTRSRLTSGSFIVRRAGRTLGIVLVR